jgi:hypothetical protein
LFSSLVTASSADPELKSLITQQLRDMQGGIVFANKLVIFYLFLCFSLHVFKFLFCYSGPLGDQQRLRLLLDKKCANGQYLF